ncbi:hypothetical protein METHP15_300018 [Pseudomonas sp. P15-2025]
MARNKRRSGFTREAPRGRRSISQALTILRHAPDSRHTILPTKTQKKPGFWGRNPG